MRPDNFQQLRDQWALKAPTPSDSDIKFEQSRDRQSNPHNDNYANKKPLRSVAEIISDHAYTFADAVLFNQYNVMYGDWLENNGYKLVWNVYKQRG